MNKKLYSYTPDNVVSNNHGIKSHDPYYPEIFNFLKFKDEIKSPYYATS